MKKIGLDRMVDMVDTSRVGCGSDKSIVSVRFGSRNIQTAMVGSVGGFNPKPTRTDPCTPLSGCLLSESNLIILYLL